MKYNIGDKVWVSIVDDAAEWYYCGPATIRYIFSPEFDWDYKVKIPIAHRGCGIKEEEIKYEI